MLKTHFVGTKDLFKTLDRFTDEVRFKGMDRAVRAGASFMLRELKKRTPVKTGNLKKSYVVRKMSRPRQPPEFIVTNNLNALRGASGWYAHIVEGVDIQIAPAWIIGPITKGVRLRRRSRSGAMAQALEIPGIGVKQYAIRFRAKPRPHWRETWDQEAENAQRRIEQNLVKFIERETLRGISGLTRLTHGVRV